MFFTHLPNQTDLISYRGGCIICMDYSAYADDYGFLLRNFKPIANVLTNKLIALREHSFQARNAYLFGFSFGSRLIARAGIDFGPKEIEQIDCKYDFIRQKKEILQDKCCAFKRCLGLKYLYHLFV